MGIGDDSQWVSAITSRTKNAEGHNAEDQVLNREFKKLGILARTDKDKNVKSIADHRTCLT